MTNKVAVISLSSGILGEKYSENQKNAGIKIFEKMGYEVIFTPNCLKGEEVLSNSPDLRAYDLMWAFNDPEIKIILCSIGGIDTYKTVKYLINDSSFINNVRNSNKIFIGYSDSTINHFLLNRLGLSTYYGQSFMTDYTELNEKVNKYTLNYFNMILNCDKIILESSKFWELRRLNYTYESLIIPKKEVKEENGLLFYGPKNKVKGNSIVGCIESIYESITDQKIYEQVKDILPTKEELKEAIVFLESSDDYMNLKDMREKLLFLKDNGYFESQAIVFGKPVDNTNIHEFIELTKEIINDEHKIIVHNLNFGHSSPRCLIPIGRETTIDIENKSIIVDNGRTKKYEK